MEMKCEGSQLLLNNYSNDCHDENYYFNKIRIKNKIVNQNK